MSNGTNEPLPGLRDDPQLQFDLPWTDFQIPPLRNPAPQQRNANAPSPLEPVAGSSINVAARPKHPGRSRTGEALRSTNITPNDVLQARESRKPHLAISELVDDNDDVGGQTTQLPSFVSLSVVEKSPTQTPQALSSFGHATKRPRLDDVEHTSHDLGRQLPRPAQREHTVPRPAPLLPAMVTGLHEPPPSAALLPSMRDPDRRPGASRSATTSKIQVKDILTHVDSRSPSPVTAIQRQLPALNSRPEASRSLPHLDFTHQRAHTDPTPPSSAATPLSASHPIITTSKEPKTRRIRRKWTDDETRDLLLGVKKHGVGKWKQILLDPTYTFDERSAVDLKDRYRVCSKDDSAHSLATLTTLTSIAGITGYPGPHPSQQQQQQQQSAPAAPSSTASGPASPNTPPSQTSPQPSHTTTTTIPPSGPTGRTSSRTTSPTPPTTTNPSTSSSATSKPRRKRRAWTSAEDASLLAGVRKHGFQWTAIHDDPSLELGHRRATDLRDRIRNKFPEGYKLAEVKPLRSEVLRRERGGESVIAGKGGGEQRPGSSSGMGGRYVGEEEEEDEVQEERVRAGGAVRGGIEGRMPSRGKEMGKGSGGGGGGGITLPSLALDEADEMDLDGDTRLPPLMLWDD